MNANPFLDVLCPLAGLAGIAIFAIKGIGLASRNTMRWVAFFGLLVCGPSLRESGLSAELGKSAVFIISLLVALIWYGFMYMLGLHLKAYKTRKTNRK